MKFIPRAVMMGFVNALGHLNLQCANTIYFRLVHYDLHTGSREHLRLFIYFRM